MILLDRAQFPRGKVCGGGLNAQLFERFPYLEPLRDRIVESTSYDVVFHSPSLKVEATYRSNRPLMFMTRRVALDDLLRGLAIEAGARTARFDLREVNVLPHSITLTDVGGRKVRAEVVIGADGANSMVGRSTGLLRSRIPRTVCSALELEPRVSAEFVERRFGPRRSIHIFLFAGIQGYGWIFPKANHLNVGVGQVPPGVGGLSVLLSRFLDLLKGEDWLPDSFDAANQRGAQLPVGSPHAKIHRERVVLVGDAASCAHPMTGEGIYYGMVSGQLAAEELSRAAAEGEFGEAQLGRYRSALWDEFGRTHRWAYGSMLGAEVATDHLEEGVRWLADDQELLATVALHGFGLISYPEYLTRLAGHLPWLIRRLSLGRVLDGLFHLG